MISRIPFPPSDATVATAPTVYGIETLLPLTLSAVTSSTVATAPTVYGIETE